MLDPSVSVKELSDTWIAYGCSWSFRCRKSRVSQTQVVARCVQELRLAVLCGIRSMFRLTMARRSSGGARSKAISAYTTPKFRTRGGEAASRAASRSPRKGSLTDARSLMRLLTWLRISSIYSEEIRFKITDALRKILLVLLGPKRRWQAHLLFFGQNL